MLSEDKDALICDLAETYGIYDYRALPASRLATLAVGLREDSRIKMRLMGAKASKTDLLLAAMVDRLSMLLWMKSEDGKNGTNRPPSILSVILGTEQEDKAVEAFESDQDFEAAWTQITGVAHGR
jgi:hypothetical protein